MHGVHAANAMYRYRFPFKNQTYVTQQLQKIDLLPCLLARQHSHSEAFCELFKVIMNTAFFYAFFFFFFKNHLETIFLIRGVSISLSLIMRIVP